MKYSFKASLLASVLAVTVVLTGCSKQGAAGGKVATVDGTVITKSEFDKTYDEFKQAFGLEKMPKEQQQMLGDTVKQMALNKLILHTLIQNEAEKAGIKVSDAEVKEYKEEKIFKNEALKGQYQQFLTQSKMSESQFDEMLRENLLLNKFMEAKGGDQIKVSDAEVKTFYEKNADQFKIPERIQASHILVKAIVPEIKKELKAKNPKISDADLEKAVAAKKQEQRTKADKLFTEVKGQPAKFETLAKTSSDDPVSAKQGGDLGYMIENNIDPAFWAAIEKTPDGKLYPGVLATQFGYHIIKVKDHEAPRQHSFTEAQTFIREQISQQKKQEFLQKWAAQKKDSAKIVIEPAYQPKNPQGMEGAAPAAGNQAR